MYNPLTCQGGDWTTAVGGWIASGDCFKIRIGFVLLFFILAIIRKWGGEEMGLSFSLIASVILGMFLYVLIAIFFGSFAWAFLAGLVGGIIGGYGGGGMFGSEGGDDYYG